MYAISFTPSTNPANALYAKGETMIDAMSALLSDLGDVDFLDEDGEFLSYILDAAKDAIVNLNEGKPATGSWSDMGCEDDAFRIDIFCSDDLKFVRYDDHLYCVPHGAIGLGIGKFNHIEWVYTESELTEWDEVIMPIPKGWEEIEGTNVISVTKVNTIEDHNKPLRDAMFARGCQWKSDGKREHFTLNGEFEPYPAGYIRGPHYNNGNPRPYQYSVQGNNGWIQLGFSIQTEGISWALETAEKVLLCNFAGITVRFENGTKQ